MLLLTGFKDEHPVPFLGDVVQKGIGILIFGVEDVLAHEVGSYLQLKAQALHLECCNVLVGTVVVPYVTQLKLESRGQLVGGMVVTDACPPLDIIIVLL